MKVQIPTPEGFVTIQLRFPTDEEWIERARLRKLVTRQISRTISNDEVTQTPEQDLALVRKICENGSGETLTAADATWILDQISNADVEEVERCGSLFRITLRVPGGSVVHTVSIPSVEDVQIFRRAFAHVRNVQEGRLTKQESVVNLAAAKTLYQKIKQSSEGYGMEVPVIHQLPVVLAVLDEINKPLSEDGAANFQ